MKRTFKTILLAALGLMAGVTIVQAQGTTTYPAGDLLIGFTTGFGNDVVYDLGQESALSNGETWNLAFLLSNYGNYSGVSWGVIGNGNNSGSPRILWTTTAVGVTAGVVQGKSKFGALNSDAGALYENFTNTGAGNWVAVSSSGPTSWNEITTPNATLGTSYINEYENPNVVGVTSASFSQVLDDGSTPTLLGTFALAANGVVTFTVPSPVINSETLSGGQFILIGTGGSASAQYRIFSTTDLKLPFASWTPVYTNFFLSNGSFAYTNSMTTSNSFFRVETP